MKKQIVEILEKYITQGYRSEKGIYDTDIEYVADDICELIEGYKICFEEFIPINKWDEANFFFNNLQGWISTKFS